MEIALCKSEGHDAQEDQAHIETALNTAERVFRDATLIWVSITDIEDRQRFQKALFPDGLASFCCGKGH